MQLDPIELDIEIDRSPDDVFEYVRDFSHGPEWQADAIEVVPEQAGPARVGTRIRNRRRTPMGIQSFTLEVAEIDEATRRVRDVVLGGMFAGTTTTIAVDAHGATSVLRMRIDPALDGAVGIVGRFGFARSRIHRSLEGDWKRNLI